MNIDITSLKNGLVHEIEIHEIYSFSEEQLASTEIISLNQVEIQGTVFHDYNDGYHLNLVVSGVMVLPCSVTLNPVDYPFETKIDGNIEDLLIEINESSKKTQNSIDILPIIWENIVMEIPIRVISDQAENLQLEGDGWKLITENQERLNPELQKLNDLLNEK